MATQIRIHSVDLSPRHSYVFDLVFKELLGVGYEQSPAETAHINYSTHKQGIHITPVSLLSETGVSQKWIDDIEFCKWRNLPCFYPTDGSIPFDMFSAIFFLVSRYEEYLSNQEDDHGRFSAEYSVLTKNKVLHLPLVNLWVLQLKEELEKLDSSLVFKPREFEYLSTIDIDQTWKFKNKGFLRSVGSTFKDLVSGKWENFTARVPVILGSKPDPFFNFDWQNKLHRKHEITSKYFWLLGKRSRFDKNIEVSNLHQIQCIQNQASTSNVEVGIHPSYLGNNNPETVKQEIEILKGILNSKITISRQHFLKLKTPSTFQNLAQLGIKEEHSLGYSTHFGFRAGIAAPFLFFDLDKNEVSNMRFYPFCMMDITPLHYLKQSPEQAIDAISELMERIKKVGGLCISLWHNESFSETERWKDWSKVYIAMLEKAQELRG